MGSLVGRVLVWLFLEREYRVTSWFRVTWTNTQLLLAVGLAAYLLNR